MNRFEAERDQLRLDCDNETKWAAHYLAQSIADKARADKAEAVLSDSQQLHAHCLRTLNEGQIAHLFGERMTEIVNRAERAEADLAAERQKARVLRTEELKGVTAERDLLCACLRDLVDEQNGAPLELRRKQWRAAMDEALAALDATEGAK